MIANDVKMKITPTTFASPPFYFPPQIFLKITPPTQFFGKLIFPFKNRGGKG